MCEKTKKKACEGEGNFLALARFRPVDYIHWRGKFISRELEFLHMSHGMTTPRGVRGRA
jgi:hypothetical protein